MAGMVTPLGPSRPEQERSADDRLFSLEHRLRRAAGVRAQPEPGPAFPRRRLARDAVVLAAAMLIGVLIGPYADAANPDYPEARAVADRIDLAWAAVVERGVAPEEAAAAAGVQAFTFAAADGQQRFVLTQPGPTAAGVCYALVFGPGIVTVAGIIADPGPRCDPQPPGILERTGSWLTVLPSQRLTPTWFVPAIVLLLTVGLVAAVDASIVVIARALGRSLT